MTEDMKERDQFMSQFMKPDTQAHLLGEYDCEYFSGLTYKDLAYAISRGWADPNSRQNNSPSIKSIMQFLHENSQFTAHGYIITPSRSDVRISIEGVLGINVPKRQRLNFNTKFNDADEFTIQDGECRAWYD